VILEDIIVVSFVLTMHLEEKADNEEVSEVRSACVARRR
jgi:hypothetical protein